MIGGSSNADAVLVRLQNQIARLSNFDVPLTRSGVIVRDAAVMRIKDQGGDQDWAPNKRGGHTGLDTGRMMNSVQLSPIIDKSIAIGTNLNYARWFQEGTGIYAGHSPWTIKPKGKKALAFTIGGVTYIRRSVTDPGQPKRIFLTIADQQRADIRSVWVSWLSGGP